MKHYVVIARYQDDPYKALKPVVIGPFDKEDAAVEHMNNSVDVEDWCTGEAKAKNYIVDDIYVVDESDVIIPSYGINAPVFV